MTTQTFIGPYRVVETIGRGGFATVYRCIDDRLEAEVAIKVLADHHASDADVRARFLAEGRILRKIDNRHLIQVHDVGENDRKQPYLVLELASRGDLRSRVNGLQEEAWKPTWDDVTHVADALLDAAGALHKSDLVHRDLSPSNVLIKSTSQRPPKERISVIRPDERLIVADLGFAKDLALSSGQTVGGGTPHFSAPEQFNHGQVTHKSDLYAIAKVLEWFVRSIEDGDPQRVQFMAALAPALSADPNDRPDSAAQMNDTISTVIQDQYNNSIASTLIDPPSRQVPDTTISASSVSSTQDPQISNSQTAPALQTDLLTGQTPRPLTSSPKPRRWLPWFLGGVAVILGVVLGAIGLMVSGVFGTNEVTTVGTNLGRISASNNQVVLDGPLEIPVGRTGRFVATVPDSSTLVWTLPGGQTVENTEVLDITGTGNGSGELKLNVVTADDKTIEVKYDFKIVASE